MWLFKTNERTTRILESIITTLVFLWIVFDRLCMEAMTFQTAKDSPNSSPEAKAEIDYLLLDIEKASFELKIDLLLVSCCLGSVLRALGSRLEPFVGGLPNWCFRDSCLNSTSKPCSAISWDSANSANSSRLWFHDAPGMLFSSLKTKDGHLPIQAWVDWHYQRKGFVITPMLLKGRFRNPNSLQVIFMKA